MSAKQSEIEALRAQLAQAQAKLAAANNVTLKLKVSEKGGVSVYGLGRFPVTLYKEQWARLLDAADAIRAFIKAHDGQLKAKGE
jgi:hypothetical protein